MENKRGLFIAIEGVDGSGKTTQARLLRQNLINSGRRAFLTAEPTCKANHTPTPAGAVLGNVLKGKTALSNNSIAALFVADRVAHNTDPRLGITKLLDSGMDVITSRYYYSNLAYQGDGENTDWIIAANLDCPDIERPDICFFLDIDPAVCNSRVHTRQEEAEIYEQDTEMLEKTRQRFFSAFDKIKNRENIIIINAARSIEEIAEELLKIALGHAK